MSTKEELKAARTKHKKALTRLESKVNRYIAESDKHNLVKFIDNLKTEFLAFEEISEKYHSMLEDENDIEESDNYIIDVETKYADSLKAATKWLESVTTVKEEKPEKVIVQQEAQQPQPTLSSEVLNAIHLPKLELCTYDGDPLQYYTFITAFDETVDIVDTSGSAKLSRLVSYTTGAAKKAISSCLMVGGEKGYQLAKRTLKERFGDDLVISQAIISSLRDGPPVKTAFVLRKLGGELSNSTLGLTRLSNTH